MRGRRRNRKWNQAARDRLLLLRLAGYDVDQIAAELNRTATSIRVRIERDRRKERGDT